jgi:hypothetical protein
LEATGMQNSISNENEQLEKWLVTFQAQLEQWMREARSKRAQELIDFFTEGRLPLVPSNTADESLAAQKKRHKRRSTKKQIDHK